MYGNVEIIGCHECEWTIPSDISTDLQDVYRYHIDVELLINGNERLAWIITFTGGDLKMWIGSNEGETYHEMLDLFIMKSEIKNQQQTSPNNQRYSRISFTK